MTTVTDLRDNPSACSACGAHLSAATGADNDDRPNEGDVSVCITCGNITIFDENLKLRPATPEEYNEIASAPLIQRMLADIGRGRTKQ